MANSAAQSADFRKQIKRTHIRQGYLWVIFLALVIALLSIFSAGFFLYTAVVVTSLLILSMAIASVSIVAIQIGRNVSSGEIQLGEAIDTFLTIHNNKTLPAFWVFIQDHIHPHLDVEGASCSYKTIASSSKQVLKYKLHSTRRGLFRIGPTVIESCGPFGLIRRFLVGSSVDFVTVLPPVVPIGKGLSQGQRPVHQVPRRRSIFEDPSRFIGMRDYLPGDSMRRINWRATARTGKIQVKLFEPSILTGVLLAVDMSIAAYPYTRAHKNEIDPLLELTITTAASLSQYVLSGDQAVGLISNGTDAAELYPDDWKGGTFQRLDQALNQAEGHVEILAYQPVAIQHAKGSWQQERLLTALARLLPSASIELPNLLMTEIPRLPRQLVLMVITPRIDAALSGVLESLKRSGIETGVVWVQLEDQEPIVPQTSPQHVPIYIVRNDADLEQLGGQTL
jgi:uncharacterized protein (DUF58 family)